MKVWIDKHGGMHYHKADCKAIQPSENPLHFKYEEIERQIRRGYLVYDRRYRDMTVEERNYKDITIEGRKYRPCPFCFGHLRFEKRGKK